MCISSIPYRFSRWRAVSPELQQSIPGFHADFLSFTQIFAVVWPNLLTEEDITSISAHQDPEEANQMVEEIKLAFAQGRLHATEFSLHLLQTRPAPPEEMNEVEIAQLLASIPPVTAPNSG